MSFANETRAALAGMFIKKECCELSLLWGLLRFCGTFSKNGITVRTKCREVRDLTGALLDKFFAVYGTGTEKADTSGFEITLSPDDSARIFEIYHCSEDKTGSLSELTRVFRCPNCAAMFLRGVFLAAGNLSAPDASYHLDITVGSTDSALPAATGLSAFLEEHGLPPKLTERKGSIVLYYKESELIEDFLSVIGANKAAFSLMNEKIKRELRNTVNRQNNSELANMKKVADAAAQQLEAIALLRQTKRLTHLSEGLQETARLREKYPEATLAELAGLHEPPLTKSGLNHRLTKLTEAANNESRSRGPVSTGSESPG